MASKHHSSDDDDDDVPLLELSSRKKSAPKREAAAGPALEGDHNSKGGGGSQQQAKKPRAKKQPAVGEATVDELGWTAVPPSFIFRDYNTKPSEKIAAFDMEGTLVNTKSGIPFSRAPDDWKFFNKKVPGALKALQVQGYKLVIFSNQAGIKSALTGKAAANVKRKIDQIVNKAGVPMLVMLATGTDDLRMPSTGMWEIMCRDHNGGVHPDIKESFYVGDAAGRSSDWVNKETGRPADSDEVFAANVGIGFKVPEDLFGAMEGKKNPPLVFVPPPKAEDLASSPNAGLLSIFKELADHFFQHAEDNKAKFKAVTFRRVVKNLSAFGKKIEPGNLKEVNAIRGVGEGTMAIIKEYLETGKVQELEDIRAAGKAGGSGAGHAAGAPSAAASPKSAAAAVADKFM